jgi:hypothetical protein
MKHTTDIPNERQLKAIAESGETLLKAFHDAYERDPVGAETENRRGQFTCWKRMLLMLYKESAAEKIILAASERTGLSIPPGGPLAPDGDGYLMWDSYCHMGFIGRLQ